jgi:hypothetical protein
MLTTKAKKKEKRVDVAENWNIGVWTVRSIGHKLEELQTELMNKKIDIAISSETKKKLKGTKELEHYILIYSGVPQEKRGVAGVATMINKKLMNRIYSYNFINEIVATIRLWIDRICKYYRYICTRRRAAQRYTGIL